MCKFHTFTGFLGYQARRVFPLLLGVLLCGAFAAEAQPPLRGGFDAKSRLTMHGVPRFMLGVYDSGGGFSTLESHWENQIFSPTGPRGLQDFPLNLYLNYHMGAMPIDATNALLNVLDDHGMMYLQTGNCFDTGSWERFGPGSFSIMSQAYVQAYAQHQAALGYYIMDECDDSLIPETEAHHQQLKAWDPVGITFGANLAAGYRDPALWVDAMDVQAMDPYPLFGPEPAEGYTHFIVADFTSKLRAVAKPGFPIWSVLQFFKFTSDSRLPTADEMRAHAVMSIVEGAQGIFWWDIGVNGIRRENAATVSTYMNHLKTLTTELAGLEPALLADPTPGALVANSTEFADPIAGRMAQLEHNIDVEWLFSRIQWYQAELDALEVGDTSKSGGMLEGAAHVRTRVKVVGGKGYVFAYNYKNSPTPVTFTWHRVPTSVQESKSGQVFPLTGASWSDTLGPYQARIYVIGETTPRDFHADGQADILWRHTSSGLLSLWRLNGTSVTGTASPGTVGTEWVIAGVGDVNGDGKADILWRHGGGAVHVWLMNGTSITSGGLLGNVTSDWTLAAVADVNGDGREDILWRHTSGTLAVWLMNGLSVSANGSLGSVAMAWTIAGLDDVNGDGRADIVWRHSSGTVAIWLLNGLSVIGSGLLGTVPTEWSIAAVGDFDGDARADILWRHTSGTLHAWLLDGISVVLGGFVGTIPADWQVARAVDINGDARKDILWRQTGGTVAGWLMDGLTIIGSGIVGTVATSWQIQ